LATGNALTKNSGGKDKLAITTAVVGAAVAIAKITKIYFDQDKSKVAKGLLSLAYTLGGGVTALAIFASAKTGDDDKKQDEAVWLAAFAIGFIAVKTGVELAEVYARYKSDSRSSTGTPEQPTADRPKRAGSRHQPKDRVDLEDLDRSETQVITDSKSPIGSHSIAALNDVRRRNINPQQSEATTSSYTAATSPRFIGFTVTNKAHMKKEIEAQKHIDQGIECVNQGYLIDAINHYKSAFKIINKELNRVERDTPRNIQLAEKHLAAGKTIEAIRYYCLALNIRVNPSEAEKIADRQIDSGIQSYIADDLNGAIGFFHTALDNTKNLVTSEHLDRTRSIHVISSHLGLAYLSRSQQENRTEDDKKDDLKRAIDYCSQAVVAAKNDEPRYYYTWGMANNYSNLGNAYRLDNKQDDAADCFLKALKINQKLGSKVGMALNSRNLSKMYELSYESQERQKQA